MAPSTRPPSLLSRRTPTLTAALKVALDATSTMKNATKTLQEAIKNEENTKPVGGLQRNSSLKKIVSQLTEASSEMSSFQSQICDLKQKFSNLSKISSDEHTNQEIFKPLRDADHTSDTNNNLGEGKSDLEEKPKDSKEEVYLMDICRLAVNEEHLRTENERLKKEIEEALANKEASTSALEQVERYKEVVARVTADNMVLLMKLKQSEQTFQTAQEQQNHLKKQLELSRVHFLEEVSSEIEDVVKGSLSKAEACELELQRLQKDQEKQTKELGEKLQEAYERLSLMSVLQARVRGLEEEVSSIESKLNAEIKKREEAELEAHFLAQSFQQCKEELSNVKSKHLETLQELQEKGRRLQERDGEVEKVVATLDAVSSQVDTLRAVNNALMKKKEEIEWLCLEAQAERDKLQQHIRKLIQH